MESSSSGSSSGWNCTVCTLQNSGRTTRCGACNSSRPTSTRIPRTSQAQLTKIAREQEAIKQKTAVKKKSLSSKTPKNSDRTGRLKADLENNSSNSSMISDAHSDNEMSSSSFNISASRASSSNDRELNSSSAAGKKKASKKSKAQNSENHPENATDDDSKQIPQVTPRLNKPKQKKKIAVKFFTDYEDFRTRIITHQGVSVEITEFKLTKKSGVRDSLMEEDNNNSMSKNLNFLNQIPKFDSS